MHYFCQKSSVALLMFIWIYMIMAFWSWYVCDMIHVDIYFNFFMSLLITTRIFESILGVTSKLRYLGRKFAIKYSDVMSIVRLDVSAENTPLICVTNAITCGSSSSVFACSV